MTRTSARIKASEPDSVLLRPPVTAWQRERRDPPLQAIPTIRMSAMTEGMLAGAFVGFMIGVGALFGGAW